MFILDITFYFYKYHTIDLLTRNIFLKFKIREYRCYHQKVVLIEEFWKADRSIMMLYSKKNINLLYSQGIFDKGYMNRRAYMECMENAKKQGIYMVSDLKRGI